MKYLKKFNENKNVLYTTIDNPSDYSYMNISHSDVVKIIDMIGIIYSYKTFKFKYDDHDEFKDALEIVSKDFIITIFKAYDDWYMIDDINLRGSVYKCDEFEGLSQCLKNKYSSK